MAKVRKSAIGLDNKLRDAVSATYPMVVTVLAVKGKKVRVAIPGEIEPGDNWYNATETSIPVGTTGVLIPLRGNAAYFTPLNQSHPIGVHHYDRQGGIEIGDPAGSEVHDTAEAFIAIGWRAEADGLLPVAIGWRAEATADYALAIGESPVASGLNSIAIGRSASATAENGMAIGAYAKSILRGQAFGYISEAVDAATALGYSAKATGYISTALGFSSSATGASSIGVGYNSSASGENAIAIGLYAVSPGTSSVAIGRMAETTTGTAPVAIGYASKAGHASVCIGIQATAGMIGTVGTAVGYWAHADGQDATAIGRDTTASQSSTVAVGSNATASGVSSISIGFSSQANAGYGVAIGHDAHAGYSGTQYGEVAIGRSTRAETARGIAIGQGAVTTFHYEAKIKANTLVVEPQNRAYSKVGLFSPNGTRYYLYISDAGTLTINTSF